MYLAKQRYDMAACEFDRSARHLLVEFFTMCITRMHRQFLINRYNFGNHISCIFQTYGNTPVGMLNGPAIFHFEIGYTLLVPSNKVKDLPYTYVTAVHSLHSRKGGLFFFDKMKIRDSVRCRCPCLELPATHRTGRVRCHFFAFLFYSAAPSLT